MRQAVKSKKEEGRKAPGPDTVSSRNVSSVGKREKRGIYGIALPEMIVRYDIMWVTMR